MTEIYKVAKTRVQKLYEAGLLSNEAENKVYEQPKVLDNLNNRINAKAQRRIGNLNLDRMNTKRYKGYANINAVGARAPIDAKRIMKRQGHYNSAVISKLNKELPHGVEVIRSPVADQYKGSSTYTFSPTTHVAEKIKLPLVIQDGENALLNKQRRAMVAAHEIAGESDAHYRTLRALKKNHLPMHASTTQVYGFGSHANPSVLETEKQLVSRLHPKIQNEVEHLRQTSPANIPGSPGLSEASIIRIATGSNVKVPFLKTPRMTDEQHKMIMNQILGTRNERNDLSDKLTNDIVSDKMFPVKDRFGNDISQKAFGVFKRENNHKKNKKIIDIKKERKIPVSPSVTRALAPVQTNLNDKNLYNKAVSFIGKHPYQTAAGAVAIGAAGYGAYKLHQRKKNNQKQNRA